jgi:O-antigen ligase
MTFLLFALAWLLPNHYPPWTNFHSDLITFTALGCLALSLFKHSRTSFSVPAISIASMLLVVVPWLQLAAGLVFFAGDAFISAFYAAGFAIAIILGYSCSQQHLSSGTSAWLLPAHALLAAAGLSALLAILQWLSLTDSFATFVAVTDIGDRAMANLGQPNQLGTLLLMGLAALVLLFELFKISRVLLILGSLLLTWAIVLTESRSAMLSALVLAGFFCYKIRARSLMGEPLRLKNADVFFWLILFGLAALSLAWVNSELLLAVERGMGVFESNGRTVIWLQTLYAIREAPWLGYGWNQTPAAQAVGALHSPGELAFTHAHNIVLDLLAWVGLPLGLLMTALFAYWLYARVRAVQSTQAICAMAILLPVLVHSMLEYPFAYAYFLVTAGLLIGVIEADCITKTRYGVSRRMAGIALAALTGIGGYSAYEYLLIEEDYRVARFENLRVGTTPADYLQPTIWIHTQMAALLTALRQPAVRGMDNLQMERLRTVSLRFGMRPLVFRYALALGLNGKPAAAEHQMQVFRGMFGERTYQRFKTELRRLQAEKYPELAAVRLP